MNQPGQTKTTDGYCDTCGDFWVVGYDQCHPNCQKVAARTPLGAKLYEILGRIEASGVGSIPSAAGTSDIVYDFQNGEFICELCEWVEPHEFPKATELQKLVDFAVAANVFHKEHAGCARLCR